MPDVFDDVFASIGADFATFMAGTAPVTVRQIDPDTGAALATANNVTALKRSRRRQMFGVGGGELGADQCRFVVRASELGFVPKTRDQVVDADGTTWEAESVEAIAFNQLAALNVVLKR